MAGHALVGAIMDYYIGLAKFNPEEETRLMVSGFLYTILCHGVYDFLTLLQNSCSSFMILLPVILLLWARMKLKKAEIAIRGRIRPNTENNNTAVAADPCA
ncbi:PrsW family intramembrane metalloprotease [candidate division WOR-3 bacterium]|nr:PrsW family intramembrane metalloprotease [candidate division WOR-3 bacterium]